MNYFELFNESQSLGVYQGSNEFGAYVNFLKQEGDYHEDSVQQDWNNTKLTFKRI